MSTEGHVYILTNPAMPGLIKIGKTSRSVGACVRELNSTGVPMPFKAVFSRNVEDMDYVERDMHEHFHPCRVNDGGEFFRLSVYSAVTKLNTYKDEKTANPYGSYDPKSVLKQTGDTSAKD